MEAALEEAAHAKATVVRLRRERETMRQEISEKDQGLVGKLKAQLIDLENALTISRNATQTLRSQLDGYKTREEEDEILRRDLFQQLEKAGAFEFVGEGKEVLDQRELLELLSKKGHRNLTVQKLEGGKKRPTKGGLTLDTDDVTLNRGRLFDDAAEGIGISHSTFSPDSDSVVSRFHFPLLSAVTDVDAPGFSLVDKSSRLVRPAIRHTQFRFDQQESSQGHRRDESNRPATETSFNSTPSSRYSTVIRAENERTVNRSYISPFSSSREIGTPSFSQSYRPDSITCEQDWNESTNSTRQRRIRHEIYSNRLDRQPFYHGR